jgi:hypothetical protein
MDRSSLTEDDLAGRDVAREFATRESPPELARQIDETSLLPHTLWERLAASGPLSGPTGRNGPECAW